MTDCPCGSGISFETCCEPLLKGAQADSAEKLMRSRYTAYVLGNLDYIENTHASEIKKEFNRSAAASTADAVRWISLEIREVTQGGAEDDCGLVEFTARFKQHGETRIHHELSTFRREDGRWVYVSGTMNPKSKPRQVTKVGRNDPCPCGSGLKFKKCCGA